MCVSISSAEQAWSGAQVVLRCLWQYARSSCQMPQHALQPCAPELWAHLERVADEAADREAFLRGYEAVAYAPDARASPPFAAPSLHGQPRGSSAPR